MRSAAAVWEIDGATTPGGITRGQQALFRASVKSGIGGEHLAGVLFRFARGSSNQQSVACLRAMNSLLPAILTVRRHRLPVIARERPIVIPDIADAPIDIRERCPLFPSVGYTADSRQGAVFHSYVGAAAAIGSLWRRFGMGGLHEHRAGDQERRKRTEKDFHGRSFCDV
jgi:hypothetical protein